MKKIMEDLLTQDHHETGRYNTDDGITGYFIKMHYNAV